MPSHKRPSKRKSKRRGVSRKKCKTCSRNRQKSSKLRGGAKMDDFYYYDRKISPSEIVSDILKQTFLWVNTKEYLESFSKKIQKTYFPDACSALVLIKNRDNRISRALPEDFLTNPEYETILYRERMRIMGASRGNRLILRYADLFYQSAEKIREQIIIYLLINLTNDSFLDDELSAKYIAVINDKTVDFNKQLPEHVSNTINEITQLDLPIDSPTETKNNQ